MTRTWKALVLAAVMLGLQACGFYVDKKPAAQPIQVEQSNLSFALVQEKVFAPRCVACHSTPNDVNGRVELTEYQSVFQARDRISRVTLGATPTMPKGQPALPKDEASLLSAWFEAGAPEFPKGIPHPPESPTPTPSASASPQPPEKLEPTYASLNKNIFQKKCAICHNPQGQDGADTWPMQTLAQLKNPDNPIVVNGSPESSLLYLAVIGTDGLTFMPKVESGIPRLTAEETSVIEAWIKNGAN